MKAPSSVGDPSDKADKIVLAPVSFVSNLYTPTELFRTRCHVQSSAVVSFCSKYQNKYLGLVTEVSMYTEILILLHALSRIYGCVVLPTEALHPTSLTLTFFFSPLPLQQL